MELNKIYSQSVPRGLKILPDNSVNCCVTSPPYYGLRDYGTAIWVGGNVNCDHKCTTSMPSAKSSVGARSNNQYHHPYKNICGIYGAIRIDEQIGLEETPELYVQKLVEVFREVKRVLRKDGTLWLNLGDSYAGGGGASGHTKETKNLGAKTSEYGAVKSGGKTYGLKPKDLIGIPWMVAFALRADGWYLRQDIIWHKPNPMPESVTDRCTKSHEYIFLLSKSKSYYYDAEAIKTPIKNSSIQRLSQDIENQTGSNRVPGKINGSMKAVRPNGIVRDRLLNYDSKEKILHPNSKRGGYENECDLPLPDLLANKKSVWEVTTKPFSEAHFATFPEDLILPCILAGSPENGVVLDPFMGAGTTALVAVKNNRNYIGFEINPEYIKIADKRILEPVEIKELGYAKTKLNEDYPTLF
jgi:DNA modification methylase